MRWICETVHKVYQLYLLLMLVDKFDSRPEVIEKGNTEWFGINFITDAPPTYYIREFNNNLQLLTENMETRHGK